MIRGSPLAAVEWPRRRAFRGHTFHSLTIVREWNGPAGSSPRWPRHAAGNQPGPRRGDRPVPFGRVLRGGAVQRRALRPPLVREDPLTGGGLLFREATMGGWTQPCVIPSTVSTPRTAPCSLACPC